MFFVQVNCGRQDSVGYILAFLKLRLKLIQIQDYHDLKQFLGNQLHWKSKIGIITHIILF